VHSRCWSASSKVVLMSIADPETLPDVLGFTALYAIWLLGLYAVVRAGWL
jgi:hypothetical protein